MIDNLSTGKRENLAQALGGARPCTSGYSRRGGGRGCVRYGPTGGGVPSRAQIDVRYSVEHPDGDAATQRHRHDQRARERAEAGAKRLVNSSTGGGLYGEAEVFRRRRTPDPAHGPIRSEQASAEGYCGCTTASRLVHGLAPLRQRLRAAPGCPRGGGRGGDLLRPPAGGPSRRPSMATVVRRAIGWR